MRLGLLSLVGFTLALPAAAQDITLRLPVACEIGRTCFIQKYVDHDPSPAMRPPVPHCRPKPRAQNDVPTSVLV